MTLPFAADYSVSAPKERPVEPVPLQGGRKFGFWPIFVLSLLAHVAVIYWLSRPPHSVVKPPPTVQTVSVSMLAPENPQPVETLPTPPEPVPQSTPKLKQNVQQTPQPVNSTTPSSMPVAEAAPAPSPPTQTTQSPPSPTLSEPRFDAAYLNNPAPVYPNMSRRLRETGMVQVRVRVDSSGRPTNVILAKSCGYARLDDAALSAVRRWKFEPAMRGDIAVEADVVVPVEFSLEKSRR